MKYVSACLLLVSFGALGTGCALSPLQADYGNSVHEMTAKQTYDPATRVSPSTIAAEGADPAMLQEAIKALRAEKVDRAKVAEPMLLQAGGG